MLAACGLTCTCDLSGSHQFPADRGAMCPLCAPTQGDRCHRDAVVCAAVATRSTQAMLDQLCALLTNAIAVALDVADADAAWATPAAQSRAGRELTAEEMRQPKPQTGSYPWLGAPLTARWALWVMTEEAKALPGLLKADATSYAADVLCRAVLETASLAWWLLDPDIDAQRRGARWLVYRLHTAKETEKAVKALELSPGEDRSDYGESVADVQKEIYSLGWRATSESVAFGDNKESWLQYTDRAAKLIRNIWPQDGLPYRMLSAVAHAELLGLARNFTSPRPGTSVPRPAPGPATVLWLWQDAYLVLGSLVLTADRASSFLGLDDQAATLHAFIQYLDRTLPALRPTGL